MLVLATLLVVVIPLWSLKLSYVLARAESTAAKELSYALLPTISPRKKPEVVFFKGAKPIPPRLDVISYSTKRISLAICMMKKAAEQKMEHCPD